MNLTNNSFVLNDDESFIDLQDSSISQFNSSNSSRHFERDNYNQAQEYAFIGFLVICSFLVLFLITFLHSFFCIICKALRCCSNDSFCYLCHYSSFDTEISSPQPNSNDIQSSSINEPLILNEIKNKTNMNYYGVALNEPANANTSSDTKYDTTSQTFDNYFSSSPIYSTNTFKSFSTTQQKINNDYLDIYNTFGHVCESINEMIARNEFEKIQSNLSKSLQEIQKIQIEMLKSEEEDKVDLIEEENVAVEEIIEEPIESFLPMPDLDTLNDADTSKLDDIVSIDDTETINDANEISAVTAPPDNEESETNQNSQSNEDTFQNEEIKIDS